MSEKDALREADFSEAFANLFPLTGYAMEVVEYAREHELARHLLLNCLAALAAPMPLDVRIDWPCSSTREAPGWCVPHDAHWLAEHGTCNRLRQMRRLSGGAE